MMRLLDLPTSTLDIPGRVEQHTAKARIQDARLLMREQIIFKVPSYIKSPLPLCSYIFIFPDIQLESPCYFYQLGIQISCSDKVEEYKNIQGLIDCQHCYTEFRVDFKSYSKKGNVLYITKWIEIGEGRDRNYYEFLSLFGFPVKTIEGEADFPRGSIFTAFEQMKSSEFRFDSLLTKQDKKSLSRKS